MTLDPNWPVILVNLLQSPRRFAALRSTLEQQSDHQESLTAVGAIVLVGLGTLDERRQMESHRHSHDHQSLELDARTRSALLGRLAALTNSGLAFLYVALALPYSS